MNAEAEIIELKRQVERLSKEVADLRNVGLTGSKTEALMALQYDSIPDFWKSPRAVAVHKKVAKAGFVVMVLGFLAMGIMIGSSIWKDHPAPQLKYDNPLVNSPSKY